MKCWIVTALAGVLLATSPQARPVRVDPTPIALGPSASPATRVGRLEYLAGFQLRSPDPEFGGLSGLLIEGDRALMVSDRGRWVTLHLRHDATGRLSGVGEARIIPMADPAGGTVRYRSRMGDAEAVTRLPDGRLAVAFEQRHRVWIYDPAEDLAAARPQDLPLPARLLRAQRNGGIEALAALPDGRLAALTETLRWRNGNLVGWLLDAGPGPGRPVEYVPDSAFLPTDMAMLPDGDLLVLERRFSLLGGIAAQLRQVPAAQLGERVWRADPVARLEPPLAVDNFEGLAVADGSDGGPPLVYIVSDDNFSVLQRTLLLQFRLLPAP